jgi:asparagine N-glycosylation enzyme membrane subunit Stt3
MNKNYWIYGIVGLLVVIAASFRVFPVYDTVFSEDGYRYLLGIDPYFYLRQVETALKNFPLIQKFDHATHYPGGLISDATGLYPWLCAGIIKLFYGSQATTNVIIGFMAWVPVLVTITCYLLVFKIATQLRNNIAGIFAVFLLLIYPGLFLHRGMLGFPDHHILEVFLGLWLMKNLLNAKIFVREPKRIFLPISGALPLILFFTIWPGAHLFLLLSAMVLAILTVIASREQVEKVGRYGLYFFFTAGLGYYVIYFLFHSFITSSFSKYDPYIGLIMFVGGAGILGLSFIMKIIQKHADPKVYQPIVFLVLIAACTLFLEYTQIGREVMGRLTFKAVGVAENKPINWVNFLDMVLISGIVSFIYLIYLAIRAVMGRLVNWTDMVFVFLAGFFIFMWMSTFDMGYMIAPYLSIVSGVALFDFTIWSLHQEQKNLGWIKRVFMAIPYILVGICFVLPILRNSSSYPYVLNKQKAEAMNLFPKPWLEAMDWMKANTPALAVPTDTIVKRTDYKKLVESNYAVLSSWDNGNLINQRGKRIPMWSRWPGERIERLLMYPPDSLKVYLQKTETPIDYLVVDDRMASIFFMSKYQNLPGVDLKNCLDTVFLTINGKEEQINTYNPCFKSSLVYKTYIELDSSLNWIEPVYASPEETVIGHFHDGRNLMIRKVDRSAINEDQLNVLMEQGSIITNQGFLFDPYLRPHVMIFRINREKVE